MTSRTPSLLLLLGIAQVAVAAPITYEIDPNHTHPMFEADHFDGLSTWRAIFRKTAGSVVLDARASRGSVDILIDMSSVDFGHDKLNDMAVNSIAPPIFEAAKYPVAHYQGTLEQFVGGSPRAVVGSLTMHGVTKPVTLHIDSFKCMINPLTKRQVCGAEASADLDRSEFGITVGKPYGFRMNVHLRIQVEAIRAN